MISPKVRARIRLAFAFSALAPLVLAARWLLSSELHDYVVKKGAEAWKRYDDTVGPDSGD